MSTNTLIHWAAEAIRALFRVLFYMLEPILDMIIFVRNMMFGEFTPFYGSAHPMPAPSNEDMLLVGMFCAWLAVAVPLCYIFQRFWRCVFPNY
jgi:hypothetical protein